MQKTVKILTGQTIADIAIQEIGIIDAWYDLAIANGKSMTDDLIAGSDIVFEDTLIQPIQHAAIKREKIIPASGINKVADGGNVVLGGIGYMAVGVDFKVN